MPDIGLTKDELRRVATDLNRTAEAMEAGHLDTRAIRSAIDRLLTVLEDVAQAKAPKVVAELVEEYEDGSTRRTLWREKEAHDA